MSSLFGATLGCPLFNCLEPLASPATTTLASDQVGSACLRLSLRITIILFSTVAWHYLCSCIILDSYIPTCQTQILPRHYYYYHFYYYYYFIIIIQLLLSTGRHCHFCARILLPLSYNVFHLPVSLDPISISASSLDHNCKRDTAHSPAA